MSIPLYGSPSAPAAVILLSNYSLAEDETECSEEILRRSLGGEDVFSVIMCGENSRGCN
ncbi:hypothetical protein M407DRAFT_30820 [Tulasnella calospora MUT 4182]|uniref:Uncharacterized protein n=1 Tax=Tulasnella calospora MUT 4182 TaxID=1051891 RepID=A0A0C3Q7K7_9AGAM|nr:hypothetical protein M407DRAFT_30820 [Tulasnella calospora MUT 4182]